MTAKVTHVSTKLILRFDVGCDSGKRGTKRVAISGIREGVSADALWAAAQAVGALLEYPVAAVELHRVSEIELSYENAEETDEKAAGDGMRTTKRRAPQSCAPVTSLRGVVLSFTGYNSDHEFIFNSRGLGSCQIGRAPPGRN